MNKTLKNYAYSPNTYTLLHLNPKNISKTKVTQPKLTKKTTYIKPQQSELEITLKKTESHTDLSQLFILNGFIS
tara:strand:- start:69 stop:290 length:222 start_codon:yes stop_codon:yes gene_type:complete